MFNKMIAQDLAKEYKIPEEDVLLIALNRYGIVASMSDKRIRFKLKLNTHDESFYFAVCVNTYPSPFTMDNVGNLILGKEVIGHIYDIEKDTCDSTYFRRNRTELTLNSNMRSQCRGCKFCGTYNLDPEDISDLNNEKSLSAYIENFIRVNQINDLRDLLRITICTGCFDSEDSLVKHILMVHDVFRKYGFTKRIRYIGSQLRSEEAMKQIERSIPYFSLSLTVECFSRRKDIMRKEKAELDMARIIDILNRSYIHGFSTNYLYIVGLDSLNVMEDGVKTLSKYINRFPIFQILQNYVAEQEEQRIPDAKDIIYYLEARKQIESILGDQSYKPRSWENYRSLFYLQYNNAKHENIRI